MLLKIIYNGISIWIAWQPGLSLQFYEDTILLSILILTISAFAGIYGTIILVNYRNKRIIYLLYGISIFHTILYLLDFILPGSFFLVLMDWYYTNTIQGYILGVIPGMGATILYFYICFKGFKNISPAKKKISLLLLWGIIGLSSLSYTETLFRIFFIRYIDSYLIGNISIIGIAFFTIIALMMLIEEIYILLFNKKQKYTLSVFSSHSAESCKKKLNTLMEREKLFKNPELQVSDLARQLEIPRSYLSELLSKHLETSFYELLNQYRIKEFCRLLNEKQNKTILELGFEAGFNSKSTLNKVFKTATGTTPGAYRRSLKIS